MVGEKSTNSALKLSWQGTSSSTDGVEQSKEFRVAVVGIGRVGNNTIMHLARMRLTGIHTIAIDNSAVQLAKSKAGQKILIDQQLTQGKSASNGYAIGKPPLEKSQELIEEALTNTHIVFIAAALDCGFESEAIRIVARIAGKKGAISIGVVTKFGQVAQFKREQMISISRSLNELRQECDTIIVVDNNKLIEVAPQIPIDKALEIASEASAKIIKTVVETISLPGLISLNFTDLKSIVENGGIAAVGMGESAAPHRAEEAVYNAIRNPLWDTEYRGITGALVHIAGDSRMTIEEVSQVGEIVTETMSNDVKVILSARVNPELNGKIRVTLIMTSGSLRDVIGKFSLNKSQLFDLEPSFEPEKKLPIDLGLYQLEDFDP